MRRAFVLLLLALLYTGVHAQTPTEMIGDLFSSLGSVEGLASSLAMAIIVGVVSYVGLNRTWRDGAQLVAGALAIATFLFTFTPGSSVGIPTISMPRFFATLPVIREYPIIIDMVVPMAALFIFLGAIVRYGKGEGKGMRNTALVAGVAMMVIGGILASFGFIGPGGAMVTIGFIAFFIAVIYYFSSGIGGSRGSSRSRRDREIRVRDPKDDKGSKFRIWIQVVFADPRNPEHQRLAQNPEGNRDALLRLPAVENAYVKLRGFGKYTRSIRERRTNNRGLVRVHNSAGGYEVIVRSSKSAIRKAGRPTTAFYKDDAGNLYELSHNIDYKRVYTVDRTTPTPQIIVPLGARAAASMRINFNQFLAEINHVRQDLNRLVNTPIMQEPGAHLMKERAQESLHILNWVVGNLDDLNLGRRMYDFISHMVSNDSFLARIRKAADDASHNLHPTLSTMPNYDDIVPLANTMIARDAYGGRAADPALPAAGNAVDFAVPFARGVTQQLVVNFTHYLSHRMVRNLRQLVDILGQYRGGGPPGRGPPPPGQPPGGGPPAGGQGNLGNILNKFNFKINP